MRHKWRWFLKKKSHLTWTTSLHFRCGASISYTNVWTWWRHQMETFFTLTTGHLCGEFIGPRWIPRTKSVTRSFDVFFDLRLNKQLSKQSWGFCWFETPSRSIWCHCNERDRYRAKSGQFWLINRPYASVLTRFPICRRTKASMV